MGGSRTLAREAGCGGFRRDRCSPPAVHEIDGNGRLVKKHRIDPFSCQYFFSIFRELEKKAHLFGRNEAEWPRILLERVG